MMTGKERVKATIAGNISETTPYFIELTRAGKQQVARHYHIKSEKLQKFIGNDLLFIKYTEPYGFVSEDVGRNLFKDEFGVVWDNEKTKDIGDWGFVDHPVKDMDISSYRFPDGKAKGRFKSAEAEAAENSGCFNLLQMTGVFDTAWHPTGFQDMLMAMAMDSEFTDKMMDMALQFNLDIIEQIPEFVDGVRFIEDWGDQRCVMMGVDHWRRYLKPRLKIMYEVVKKKGLPVFIHSCGNITELLPEIIELGADVVDPVQPEVMDINYIKKEYGKDIVLFGGMGCQSTLPNGTPEQVLKEAEKRMRTLSEGGRYIFGSSGAIPTDAPLQNVVTLIEFCQNHRVAQ